MQSVSKDEGGPWSAVRVNGSDSTGTLGHRSERLLGPAHPDTPRNLRFRQPLLGVAHAPTYGIVVGGVPRIRLRYDWASQYRAHRFHDDFS